MVEKSEPNFENNELKLNAELKNVFNQFPSKQKNGEKPIYDPLHRREVKEKLDSMLKRSFLRPAIVRLYERPINETIDVGINPDNLENEELFKLLALDSVNGGMFNPREVKNISKKLIKNIENTELRKYLEKSGQVEIDYVLAEARQEYVECFGDEP